MEVEEESVKFDMYEVWLLQLALERALISEADEDSYFDMKRKEIEEICKEICKLELDF